MEFDAGSKALIVLAVLSIFAGIYLIWWKYIQFYQWLFSAFQNYLVLPPSQILEMVWTTFQGYLSGAEITGIWTLGAFVFAAILLTIATVNLIYINRFPKEDTDSKFLEKQK